MLLIEAYLVDLIQVDEDVGDQDSIDVCVVDKISIYFSISFCEKFKKGTR